MSGVNNMLQDSLGVGSLFSGIGGLDLGLERAGMEVRFQVEIDDYCRRVLAKHWPNVARYGDIKTIDWTEVEPVDLICGGFPCQPVSLSGKRLAQEDERWLWPEVARCLRVLRPRYVLVENVPGLFRHGMGDVLGDLAALGYDAEWDCIPAALFGAPQLRKRVFVLAHAQGVTKRPGLCPYQSTPVRWRRLGDGRSAGDAWPDDADICRVAHGVPARVDRLRGLGNAVVPQVAEWIGRRIMEVAA